MTTTMVTNPDGSITLTTTLAMTFTDTQDIINTGVATMMVQLAGATGQANFAALAKGDPGQPVSFRNVTASPLAPTAAPTVSATLVTPGGAGVGSVYDIAFGIPSGAAGQQGPPGTVMNTVSGTPVAGQVVGYVPGTNGAAGQAVWLTPPQTKSLLWVQAASSFTALSQTAGTNGVMTSLTVPAQTFAWRPRVFGDVEITAAVGTRVDTQIRMGAATATPASIANPTGGVGTLVGFGRGAESALAVHVIAKPFYGAAITTTDQTPAAVVQANTAQTFTFTAVPAYGNAGYATASSLAELQIWADPI